MWEKWRPNFEGWDALCPVLLAAPAGLFLVMARAEQPVTEEEVFAAVDDDAYPGLDIEFKVINFGRIGSRVYVLDYGLWDEEDVVRRRQYLASFF
jgi:hypothetical protein